MSQTGKRDFMRFILEIGGMVAIMVFITATAFVLISRTFKNQKLSRVDSDLTAIVSGVRLLYSSQPNFDNLTITEGTETPEIKCANVMGFVGYKNVASPFGGEYTLTAIKSDYDNPGGFFEVFFYIDDASVCEDILNRVIGTNGNIPDESYCNNRKIVLRYSKHV